MEGFRIFDLKARDYDRWYDKHRVTYLNELKLVKSFGCAKALEIGVGTGRFAADTGVVVGVDPSLNMLRMASRRVQVIQALGEHLPFRDGCFDCAYLIVTLCFVADPRRVLREASRVADRVIACIVSGDSSWGRHYEKLKLRGHPIYSAARFYRVEELVELASSLGLRLTRIYGTLSYAPSELEKLEEPRPIRIEEASEYGFIGMEFRGLRGELASP